MTVLAAIEPEVAPPALRDTRRELAEEFLRGSGIEIGALHLPMPMPEGALVRYVDRMTVADLRAHYPELADLDLAPVDVVDDGELLTTFAEQSLDFIIANHFMEHCEDPIRTIETHLGKLRPGGVLFYAVPDKRYTFDFRRPRTPLAHVVGDHENGPERSRHQHYLEWQRLVTDPNVDPDDPDLLARADQLEADGYSIHFHVWTQADLVELMLHCHERFGTFEIEAIRRRSLENIVVLRKHAAPVEPSLPDARPTSSPAASDQTLATPSEHLLHELATLLPRLGVHTLLDLGCGRFGWNEAVASAVEIYVGADIDFDVILADRIRHGGPRRRFIVRDVTRDPLPHADLILCRDVLTRLDDEGLALAMRSMLRTRARYLLASTFIDEEAETPIGSTFWRPLNLERPPLSMPPPVELLIESPQAHGHEDERLALWDLDALRGPLVDDDPGGGRGSR